MLIKLISLFAITVSYYVWNKHMKEDNYNLRIGSQLFHIFSLSTPLYPLRAARRRRRRL